MLVCFLTQVDHLARQAQARAREMPNVPIAEPAAVQTALSPTGS
jgi:hypothetical protein